MFAAVLKGSPMSELSGLDLEETELKLALPGGGTRSSLPPVQGDGKRGFSDVVELTLGGSSRGSQPDAASMTKAQIVGWPPVTSFRRTAMKSYTYVKVAVDGAPYLRKVDLDLYSGYQELLSALEEMFSCFTILNSPDERRLVDTVNGMEYVPTYEDNDGDWMLLGDVPWKMFVESCRRLRLMKSSDAEAVNLAPRTPQRCTNTLHVIGFG